MFYILLDFIQTQEELTTLKGSTAKGSTNAGENAELRKKIKVLQAELETVQSDADRDLCEYPTSEASGASCDAASTAGRANDVSSASSAL